MRERRGTEWASRQLVAICRGDEPESPETKESIEDLVRAVRYHRIAPLAHVSYRDAMPPLAAGLRPDRDHAVGIHLRAAMLLDEVRGLLHDVPWVTFKGPVLSETAHPRAGLRSYHDVDLLVSPGDLRQVCEILAAAGWTVTDYEDMLRNPEVPGEMHWTSPAGLLVDLHWSMTNTAVRRARLSVPTDDLLTRRRQVAIGLGRAWTLDLVDSLVHVGLHAALTGANRLLLLLDVDQVARQVTDWAAVATRAKQWRAEHLLYLVLARSRHVLDTPLPTDLAEMFGVSRSFDRLCSAIDGWAPVPAARREPGLARMVARAVRPGAARTLVSVGRSAALGVGERVRRPKAAPRTRVRADEQALGVYLDAVESAART